MKREQIQKQAVTTIIENNRNCIIDVAPRVGKSKIAIEAVRDFEEDVLISVPFSPIKKSWETEFQKWGMRKFCAFIW